MPESDKIKVDTMLHNKKGFTLIEMLVVIAIIAILVAVVVPAVGNSTARAKATTDVVNLRVINAELNIYVLNGVKTIPEILSTVSHPTSQLDPDAVIYAVYSHPGFIEVFYVNGDVYYGFDYLSELAANGPKSPKLEEIGTAKPDFPNSTWYTVNP